MDYPRTAPTRGLAYLYIATATGIFWGRWNGGQGGRRRRSTARSPAYARAGARGGSMPLNTRLASPKERAEHLMLVDLARNDLGRVCVPGSVRLLAYERSRYQCHAFSFRGSGRLSRAGRPKALAASFPAGTVSGAPKVRAMELIAALEARTRGFYAGAVLQHDLRGNLDSCIAIRSASIENGRITIQAGAGIVADSRPVAEYQEAVTKLAAIRRAVAIAEAGA